jgi:hypothetical protein
MGISKASTAIEEGFGAKRFPIKRQNIQNTATPSQQNGVQ